MTFPPSPLTLVDNPWSRAYIAAASMCLAFADDRRHQFLRVHSEDALVDAVSAFTSRDRFSATSRGGEQVLPSEFLWPIRIFPLECFRERRASAVFRQVPAMSFSDCLELTLQARQPIPLTLGTTLPEHSLARGSGRLYAYISQMNHDIFDIASQSNTC